MVIRSVPALALLGLLAAPLTSAAPPDACLHGRRETTADRQRREQALRVAAAINRAEVTIVGPGTPTFRPLDALPNVPQTPSGFLLRFYLGEGGRSYLFSIRDTLDACRYTIFSDQDRQIYDGSPKQSGPIVVPTR
jgi:hypothetical protein